MAEDRVRTRWIVLPCVDSMAQADWLAPLRASESLTMLPPALVSTLQFRVQRDTPDVIVMTAGGEAAASPATREVFADTPTLLLADAPGNTLVRRAEQLHIASVLPAESSPQQLVAAIAATALGLAVRSPRASAGALDRTPKLEHLTAREVEVLRWMARGYRNRQIAARLAISEHTAKFHVSSVIAKLGARTRTEAVTIGMARGLVAI